MMKPGLTQRKSNPADFGVVIETIVDHYDHICQIAGNANHIAIGSDLDGTFGTEQSPTDLNTIADLAKLPDLLTKRGYSAADIEGVMSGNWLRLLRKAWAN
jgi:membrane dipeptidase